MNVILQCALPFCTNAQRAKLAQCASFVHQLNSEVPYEHILVRRPFHGEPMVGPLHRARRITLEQIHLPLLIAPMATSLTLVRSQVFQAHAPRLKYLSSFAFEGLSRLIASLPPLEYTKVAGLSKEILFLTSPSIEVDYMYNVSTTATSVHVTTEVLHDQIPPSCTKVVVENGYVIACPQESVAFTRCTFVHNSLGIAVPVMFSENTTSITLNDCNVIESDLVYLPSHLKKLDLSDNDTLASLPGGLSGLTSLNLLHTRVPLQAKVALETLTFPADFLGINVTPDDVPYLRLLLSKQIGQVELCVSPSIADVHDIFHEHSTDWATLKCHRWSSFPSTWKLACLRETLSHAMVHMCKCSNFISKARWNRCP